MDLGLKNKIALIAGASKGLGEATARQLAREGARVAIVSRTAEKLAATAESIRQETGAEVVAIPGDVASADDIERMIQATVQQLGGLDVVVANGGGPPPGRFEEFNDDAWSKAVNLLLLSSVRLIRGALPHLRQSSSPAVLTITSLAVKQPIPNLILSNSIRSAVIGLTKSLALELGPDRIRVNSILPATTETDRITALATDNARRNGTTLEEELKKQAAASPLGRIASPQEFANVAAFLCSPAASYLTGVMLSVDGGMYKGMV
jgi:3-oxoacyl-[acyl-carrier protein] reductase